MENANYSPVGPQLCYELQLWTPLHTCNLQWTYINISQDRYLLAGSKQNWDVSGYWSGCAVTMFYAVYHFCSSQLLSTCVVLLFVLTV
jgi:hypothetical protein